MGNNMPRFRSLLFAAWPPTRMALMVSACALAVVLTCAPLTFADQPVAVLDAAISGHIHPSICQTPNGVLVVVYQGTEVLMCARSTDGGQTWTTPVAIATTAKRPDSIREKITRFEIYPGTADTLPDGRVLVTWNYIADAKDVDEYYERALLYTLSSDDGKTWSEQQVIGPINGKHLDAVRHNVLPWKDGRWLLPLRMGIPRLFDPKTGELTEFPVPLSDGTIPSYPSFQQIIRTVKGSLLAMGPETLHSTDDGKTWTTVENFPVPFEMKDHNFEGRYLTALQDGRVLVTWGLGNDNKGLRYNVSLDDGQTWGAKRTVILLPETHAIARYYSARTIQLDDQHIGTVFMNPTGIYFFKANLDRLTK
jgi:hypothetical protein